MKIQCPKCKEIVLMDRFETSPEGLRFRCPECREILFVKNKANLDDVDTSTPQAHAGQHKQFHQDENRASDITDPASFPQGGFQQGQQRICPKCGHAQNGGTSCHKCGLDFLRFDPSNLPPDPEPAARIWSDIEHEPQEQQLHEKFVSACNKAGRLDYASRQYRILSRLPGMANISQRMLSRILSLAQAQIMPGGLEATPRDDPKKTSKVIVWLLFLVAMGAIAYLIYASSELLEKMY